MIYFNKFNLLGYSIGFYQRNVSGAPERLQHLRAHGREIEADLAKLFGMKSRQFPPDTDALQPEARHRCIGTGKDTPVGAECESSG